MTGDDITLDNLEIAHENEIPVLGQVGQETAAGFEVKIGEYTGFCPYSQIDSELKNQGVQGKN